MVIQDATPLFGIPVHRFFVVRNYGRVISDIEYE
jgi:hypothetical protein